MKTNEKERLIKVLFGWINQVETVTSLLGEIRAWSALSKWTCAGPLEAEMKMISAELNCILQNHLLSFLTLKACQRSWDTLCRMQVRYSTKWTNWPVEGSTLVFFGAFFHFNRLLSPLSSFVQNVLQIYIYQNQTSRWGKTIRSCSKLL